MQIEVNKKSFPYHFPITDYTAKTMNVASTTFHCRQKENITCYHFRYIIYSDIAILHIKMAPVDKGVFIASLLIFYYYYYYVVVVVVVVVENNFYSKASMKYTSYFVKVFCV